MIISKRPLKRRILTRFLGTVFGLQVFLRTKYFD
jgi:hypothetical protein